jgi:hypothetical protein
MGIFNVAEARHWLAWIEEDKNRELWRGQQIAALKGLIALYEEKRDPDCPMCYGTGEYFWHTPNCESDFCVLAGGVDDCDGEVVECNCTPKL